MSTAPSKSGSHTFYIVQPYERGARGSLKAAAAIQCSNEQNARARAERMMALIRVVGVDIVRQVSDPEIGDYGEPEYLARFGEFPALD